MLEVGYDAQPREFAAAIHTMCLRRKEDWREPGFPARTWRELADIGFFELAREGDAAAPEIAAVMEALGEHGCPGPLWEAVLAARALGRPIGVASVSVDGRLWPWAGESDVFVLVDADGVAECAPGGEIEPVTMLTGDVWGRMHAERLSTLDSGALALGRLAMAAYLAGAGTRLVRDAAAYVATRVQFRRPLGDFQAVAFPLAEADASLAAAGALVRRAATTGWEADAAVALRSAVRASRAAVHTGMQAYGAMAFTEECEAVRYGRRIAQIGAQAERMGK